MSQRRNIAGTLQLNHIDKELHLFLKDLVSEVIIEFGDEIVSIAMFGSATTKEWIKGKSDVDFILVIRNREQKKRVEDSLNEILLELDMKHNLHLMYTCSSYLAPVNKPIISFLRRVENVFLFGRPFYVLSLDQIAFKQGYIADPKIQFVTAVFDPLSIFLAKMKQTGVTIYGNDFIQEIRFSHSKIVKIRVALAPLWLVLVSLLSFLSDMIFSLNHAVKATIWACEDVLFALDLPLSSTAKELQILQGIFSRQVSVNISHAWKACRLKHKHISIETTSKGFVAKFILQTIVFIFILYYKASLLARSLTRRN